MPNWNVPGAAFPIRRTARPVYARPAFPAPTVTKSGRRDIAASNFRFETSRNNCNTLPHLNGFQAENEWQKFDKSIRSSRQEGKPFQKCNFHIQAPKNRSVEMIISEIEAECDSECNFGYAEIRIAKEKRTTGIKWGKDGIAGGLHHLLHPITFF